MTGVAHLAPNAAAGGFYTPREAARLLQMPSARVIRSWLSGHTHSGAGPIIQRQYKPIDDIHEIGFLDLMEIRFVHHFRQQKISLQSLRRAAANARRELQQEHPFATSNVRFMADRKEIFLHTAEETGDDFLLNLMTNQIEIYEALEQILAKGVTFNPRSAVASRFVPLSDCPNVIVDPRIAFGRPVIAPQFVPTETLFSLWKAEDGDYRAVADWFHIGRDQAEEAIEFEVRLAA
jgi:uncharacterized protein (DUF433 family)